MADDSKPKVKKSRAKPTPIIAPGPGKVSAKSAAGGCDCEAIFAGLPAGVVYWDGDGLAVLEFPVGGGPYGLQWVAGVPVWVNLT